MRSNFKLVFKLAIALSIAIGTLLSSLDNDSVTFKQVIKEHKTFTLNSLVGTAENNFEDEDGLQEKGRVLFSSTYVFTELGSFLRVCVFSKIESTEIDKRAFALFRYLRI